MPTYDDDFYICVLIKNAKFVAVDSGSGGYPYEAVSMNDVKFWDSEKQAQKYADIWDKDINNSYNMKMIVKHVKLTEVDLVNNKKGI